MSGIATLKKGEGCAVKAGGLWIYDNEIESVVGSGGDGDIVAVRDFDGYPIGFGFYNRASKISIRMMTRGIEREVDDALLEERVRAAWVYRKRTVDTGSCRMIFGEADFLPGLVVDKYGDVLVAESMALGIDRLKMPILDAARRVLREDGIEVRGIYERSDAKIRLKEGMERVKGFIGPEFDTRVPIEENGIRYVVDVRDGQKTGFFLDQKYNRLAIRRICEGADVLDCFTHTGGFALNAAAGGAVSVTGIDSSEPAVALARENAELNGMGRVAEFRCADVFELLPELEGEGRLFDVVILDPPAFTKSRESVKGAVRGYREINRRAMRLVREGGFLATCTCSHFMDAALFEKTISQAASAARRRLRLVEARGQSPDHPVLLGADESAYLKFFIFQVL